jgi:hypothetical protein
MKTLADISASDPQPGKVCRNPACIYVGLSQPLTNFSPLHSSKDGRHTRCKTCRNAAASAKADIGNPERRRRRSWAPIDDAIIDLVTEHAPVTLRQLYYLLVAGSHLEKTTSEYTALCKRVVGLREKDRVPWENIVDNTRRRHVRYTLDGLQHGFSDMHRTYNRNLWARQPDYVEIWTEKDTLVGVLDSVTERYDVPLVPVRGQSSVTFLKEMAEIALHEAAGRPHHIYYVGDQDPTGVHIPKEKWLHKFRRCDEWNLCLTAGTVVPANQERR